MQVLAVCWSTALSDCWQAARSGRHHAKAASTAVSAERPKEPQEGPEMIVGTETPYMIHCSAIASPYAHLARGKLQDVRLILCPELWVQD